MPSDILVSTRKGLFTVSRGRRKSGWKVAGADFLGDNVTLALHDRRDGAVYAALDHGHFGVKIHRADKPGGAFTEIAVPAYPEKPADVNDVDMWGRPIPWSTVRVWALEPGGADEPGVIWCGTLPGGLFRSTNRGDSWEMNRSLWDHPARRDWVGGGADLPGIHSVAVDPRNSDKVHIGVSVGGVWYTGDRGKSWEVRAKGMRQEHVPPEKTYEPNNQDAHFLAQCASAPEHLWVQHHNGIFRSTDSGTSWSEITAAGPSTFGFGVAVHPKEPGTAWFVPGIKDERRIPVGGKLVVTRTRDGGSSFDVLTKGLPQQHAYDLVLRHGLAIDPDGDCLAIGSTTGGLWVSEDQGDAWQEVSHTLPPVYAVRFMGG